jgi:long-chain acyl-CoA synthetase
VPPEPIEEKIAQQLAGAQQVVVVGNGRGYLCVLITGQVAPANTQKVIDTVNAELPHYRQIRSFSILPAAFTEEDGLLTANGKLRRDAIERRFSAEIATMYSGKTA